MSRGKCTWRIKKIRERLGLNQHEMANELGVSYRAYQNYETGKNEIPVKIITLLCTKYCVNSEWILTGEGEMLKNHDKKMIFTDGKADHPTIGKIVAMLKELSEDDLKNIEADIKKAADYRRLKQRLETLEGKVKL